MTARNTDVISANIVLITPDDQARAFLAAHLRKGGYVVVEKKDAKSVLEALPDLDSGLVIVDAALPKSDALRIERQARTRRDSNSIGFLWLRRKTRKRGAETMPHGREHGVISYPLAGADLLRQVRSAVRAVRTERELEDRTEQFRQIIEHMPSPVLICNRQGTAIQVNPALLRTFAIPSPDLVIGTFNAFTDTLVERLGLRDALAKVLRGESVIIPEVETNLADIEPRYQVTRAGRVWHEITLFPVTLRGQVAELAAILRDITVTKQRELQLRESNERLQAWSRRLIESREVEQRHLGRRVQEEVGTVLRETRTLLERLAGRAPAWARGGELRESLRRLSEAVAKVEAMQHGLPPARLPLTPRQRAVFQLMAEGKTTKEIAYLLRLSPKTVEFHRAQLMKRLQVQDMAALIRLAVRLQLVPPEA